MALMITMIYKKLMISNILMIMMMMIMMRMMMLRYWQVKKKCPKCEYQWSDDISSTMFNLQKVSLKLLSTCLPVYLHT